MHSIRIPASAYSPAESHTVGRAPSTVATEASPPSRSGTTSCTAPNICEAMPHRKNPASRAHSPPVNSAPASVSPYTAGETKCVAEVAASRNGRSLNRSPAHE